MALEAPGIGASFFVGFGLNCAAWRQMQTIPAPWHAICLCHPASGTSASVLSPILSQLFRRLTAAISPVIAVMSCPCLPQRQADRRSRAVASFPPLFPPPSSISPALVHFTSHVAFALKKAAACAKCFASAAASKWRSDNRGRPPGWGALTGLGQSTTVGEESGLAGACRCCRIQRPDTRQHLRDLRQLWRHRRCYRQDHRHQHHPLR